MDSQITPNLRDIWAQTAVDLGTKVAADSSTPVDDED